MTPAGFSLKVVQDRLALVRASLVELRALPTGSLEDFLADRRNAPTAAYHLQIAIQSLFDTARHLLTRGFDVRVLEYKQIAQEAERHGLIEVRALARSFFEMAGYRNRLIHHYEEVNAQELHKILTEDLGDVEGLARELERSAESVAHREEPSEP